MARVLNVAVALAVAAAFLAWATGLGGSVEIRTGELWVGVSLAGAVVLLGGLFLLFHLVLRLYGWMLGAPERRRLRVALDERAMAELAMSRAMVAIAAGRGAAAREEVARARRMAGDTAPLLALEAEAARVAGDEAAAAIAYQRLAQHEDAKFLGLQGLMRQAEARGDAAEAARLATEAALAEPGAEWLRVERAEAARRRQDWGEALALAAPGEPVAPLALAAARQAATPEEARALERRALQADPGFAPAVLAYAARLGGEAGREVLREGYERAPHPGIAAAWLAGATDPGERLRLVDDLTRMRVQHEESRALRAEAALAAGDLARARQELMAWEETSTPDRRWCWMMEALERGERGEHFSEDTANYWRHRAENTPPAPGWVCRHCGAGHSAWEPVCAACGTPGGILWGPATPA